MKNFLYLLLLSPMVCQAQKLGNLKAVLQGEKIVITYDVTDDYPGDKFDVSLYASHNNYSSPLQRLTGDVGRGLSPGTAKRIEWDAKAEIGNYKGELSFEVRAEVLAAFALTSKVASAKRGKSLPLSWRGGSKGQDVKIELLKSGTRVGSVGTVSNGGSYQWSIPSKQKTGSGYQLRLMNGNNVITTEPFAIKQKIPILLKVLPIVAVATVVALLVGNGDDPTDTKDNPLSSPPDMGLD